MKRTRILSYTPFIIIRGFTLELFNASHVVMIFFSFFDLIFVFLSENVESTEHTNRKNSKNVFFSNFLLQQFFSPHSPENSQIVHWTILLTHSIGFFHLFFFSSVNRSSQFLSSPSKSYHLSFFPTFFTRKSSSII